MTFMKEEYTCFRKKVPINGYFIKKNGNSLLHLDSIS